MVEKVKLVQFQVVTETAKDQYNLKHDVQVIYALDSIGNLWKKVCGAWSYVTGPDDNE